MQRTAVAKISVSVAAWVACVGLGFGLLEKYDTTPGVLAKAGGETADVKGAAEGRSALLVFLHPGCPCSRATLAELETIVGQAGDRVAARVYFVQPEGWVGDQATSDLERAARAIPHVEVIVDKNAEAVHHYGAKTSGQVLLFDGDGKLVFNGGITDARGMVGDNIGCTSIDSYFATGLVKTARTQVYGCSLE